MAGIRDGKGKILKKTESLFTELARSYPLNNYTSFCNELNVEYDEANQILTSQHLGNQLKALKQVLNTWLKGGKEVTRAKLESALENAETGGLKSIVKKHFRRDNLEEESSESSEDGSNSSPSSDLSPETESTSSRGKRKGAGARESGTKRKTKDARPGPSTNNKKKKVAPKDSNVTDSDIESLAEDINISTKLDKLGLKLGFNLSAMKKYKAMNRKDGELTSAGTMEMLLDWRNKKGQGKASLLKKALIDADLTLYAEKYFRDV